MLPTIHQNRDPRRAILINRNAYRRQQTLAGARQQTLASNHTAEVLHTLCSAMALGLFVVGGFMMIVALA